MMTRFERFGTPNLLILMYILRNVGRGRASFRTSSTIEKEYNDSAA